MSITKKTLAVLALVVMALSVGMATIVAEDAEKSEKKMEMKKPETVVISGRLIDITCAAKGMKMTGKSFNAENDDHMTPDGKKVACATMCLKGGLPAGIYADGKISAVLLANPSVNLYKFAAKNVDVKGFYAGSDADTVKTFNPAQIRLQGDTEWTKVQTRAMHDM